MGEDIRGVQSSYILGVCLRCRRRASQQQPCGGVRNPVATPLSLGHSHHLLHGGEEHQPCDSKSFIYRELPQNKHEDLKEMFPEYLKIKYKMCSDLGSSLRITQL